MAVQLSTNQFIKHVLNVAENYGFTAIETYSKNPTCSACSTPLSHSASAADKKHDNVHGFLTNGTQLYCEYKLHSLEEAPILAYSVHAVPYTGEVAIAFHVFNVPKSIAETLLIQMLTTLLKESGVNEPNIRINSQGDAESFVRYQKDLTAFLRKRIDHLPPEAREAMKVHAFESLLVLQNLQHEMLHKTPSPLEYLSDNSRKHFREVVEFLDMSGIPYEIDSKLLGHHECYSETIFTFDTPSAENRPDLFIQGGRYSSFIQKHTQTSTSAAGAVLVIKDHKLPKRISKPTAKKAKIYAVQLGFGPKLRTLMLINELRSAQIPVHHQVVSDSLSGQLQDAEDKQIPYAVIIGQKEYVEGTVILRDIKTHDQEIIPQEKLVQRLKRRKFILNS